MTRIEQRGRLAERLAGTPLRWLALPAWCLYRPAVALRNRLYDLGWLAVLRPTAPVVSIGNLSAGGTGKTPMAALVVERLRARGRSPAVLSRGYRGGADGNDEAKLIDAPVLCDADRARGAAAAQAQGADALVLDDGFQHRRLGRDLDIVLVDGLRPWGAARGRGAVLPLGLLREGRSGLRRADLLVVTRCDLAADGGAATVDALRPLGVPVLRAAHRPVALRPLHPLHGGAAAPPSALAGRPVVLASGIGNPGGFEATAAALGWSLRSALRFADHHAYTAADAQAILAAARAAGATAVVTAKDAVKLAPLLDARSGVQVLEVRMALDAADTDLLERGLDLALQRARTRGVR